MRETMGLGRWMKTQFGRGAKHALFATLFVMAFSGAARAATFTVTWTGGTGNWSDTTKWAGLPAGVAYPDNNLIPDTFFNVRIDGSKFQVSNVTLNVIATIGVTGAANSLQVDAGETLTIPSGTQLTVIGSSIDNKGTIKLDANVDALGNPAILAAQLILGARVTLSGGGALTLLADA